MKLYLKQKILSWFDSYNIYDENDEIVYKVKGRLSWGHLLKIYDNTGNEVGTIKEKIITIMPKFILYNEKNKEIGSISKKITLFKPSYKLSCNDWEIDGNILEWNYKVKDKNKNIIMTAKKKLFKLTDTYEIDIENKKDALLSLMIVLSIDIDKCSNNKND